jgi:phytoene dehydrogenase-like protein
LTEHFDEIAEDALGPLLRWPGHPVAMARLGLRAAVPPNLFARGWFRGEWARALFAGCAAHAFRPLHEFAGSALAAMHIAAGHCYGWPVAAGGSSAISGALAAMLTSLGGDIRSGHRVRTLRDIPPSRAVILNTSPGAAADILGTDLPGRRATAYRRYRHGPAAYKLDLAVRGGIPWRAEQARRAGTVHVGGSLADIALSERQMSRGSMPDRPFVLVGQQYLADPQLAAGELKPVYAYAHVPFGYTGDATAAITAQIERFAPGFVDRIEATHVLTPDDFARHNPNFVGGDILTGQNTMRQIVSRPALARHPYFTGAAGIFLCSAATPPGAGTHGMAGLHAARAVTKFLHSVDTSRPTVPR